MKKVYILKVYSRQEGQTMTHYVAGSSFVTGNIQGARLFSNRKAADKAKREWISAMDWPRDTPLVEVVQGWNSHGLVM